MENNTIQVEDENVIANEFAINTAKIYHAERVFGNDPEFRNWKKLTTNIIRELETEVQDLLVKFAEPTVKHNEEQLEYLKERNHRFLDGIIKGRSAFYPDYFVASYSRPLESIHDPAAAFGDRNFYYLYSYDTQLVITREMVDPETFDLLFAFSLRECDLMKVVSFLNYHLENNCENDLGEFIHYLKNIQRKFSELLFSPSLIEAISEWISDNEKLIVSINKKKIKSVLTVNQLSYLFKALYDIHLLTGVQEDIIEFAATNFETKRQSNLSEGSVNSKYYSPTIKTLDFWEDQFNKLIKLVIREKQKAEKKAN